MRIVSVGSAFPPHYYTQAALVEAFVEHWGAMLPDPRKLELLHANSGVDGRYLALPVQEYPALEFGRANDVWIRNAVDLGEKSVGCAIERAGVEKDRAGAFFFVSVTGVASPSVDARLVNRMRLPTSIRRVPIFGLGCVAGAAGIARAADFVKAYPEQFAILLSVELCSLTLQREDTSVANLVSTGLFGDGAAAVIVAGRDCPVRRTAGPEIVATQSTFYPDTERVMGWDITDTGFRIVLSPEVPDVIARNLGADLERLLGAHGLQRSDIGRWILHTGGPKVLRATEQALGLKNGALAVSWDCLRRMGNLSSASVLMVLEDVVERKQRPEPRTWGVLAAMGPGFCSELVLVRW
jgi:alkylresorcinol/alkylpyrone synthase